MDQPKSSFVDAKKVENLVAEATEKREYTCAICCSKFKIHDELLKHFLRHGNNDIDFRGQPRKRFTRHSPKNPNADTMIQCEWCTEKFAEISRAIMHKHKKHPNVFTNYYCEYCAKLFPFRISLIQHQFVCQTQQQGKMNDTASTSSNPGPLYKCVSCDAKFFSLNAKSTHEKNTHFASNSNSIAIPPPSKKIRLSNARWCSIYYCHLCGNEYEIKHNLRKHLENQHTEEERTKFPTEGIIKCKHCESLFHSKNAYKVHNSLCKNSEEESLRKLSKVDQDVEIPNTIKLTPKGKIPKKYSFMNVKVNLSPLDQEKAVEETLGGQNQNK